MKFLEYTPLDSINLFLNHLSLGESTINGNLEAFSCKQTGTDRKLSFSLEQEILDYLEQSSDSDSASPMQYLTSRSSRKTLIYLVLTLSHMYPDYDFSSAVRSHLYFREEEWDSFKQIFETYLFEAAREWTIVNGESSFMDSMTNAIDEVVKLKDCEIYSYNPDFEGDLSLEKGAIWSFNFFFYNKKLKRVVSFRCCCFSNLAAESFLGDEMVKEEEEEEEEEDYLVGMDM
uniref:Repressor of RNA polymerase III transcription n=1 Tax=Musa acuminata subsp. malaccensis TaxID=214687 RepID=A0A804IA64_MUSAM|nr:PREDICTED: repressor of RNA polymerase III transcription MAF1 homolog isoform X1 [Musa acuminata subsp. malaccensis]XP_009391649.1 PREDICTED: repressor of RNA polymerase III transcription MAF1 homolog isoform X1 [Musa acuminata subsp. malaccensis]XP_009391650.1 PREDICTED: repressor of RNA polymerase III transcription MAF1 homolog isoform X1 [Musa acuminata subsp. malaccensis]